MNQQKITETQLTHYSSTYLTIIKTSISKSLFKQQAYSRKQELQNYKIKREN